MRVYHIKIVLAVLLCCSLLLGGCSLLTQSGEQPVTINIWHVYGAQTDSPLNDFIQIFNETVGKEQGIQVEVSMVSNNKNIHRHILAAANKDPGVSPLPDIFVAYPKTVLALPDESILVDYRDYFTEEELAALQRRILAVVKDYVKPGGKLLYSTCTINRRENEENAQWFAGKYPEFSLVREQQRLPGKDEGDGFYLALFRRRDDE